MTTRIPDNVRNAMVDALTAVIDGNITGTGGGGDMELDDTSIVSGGVISVTSWTITMPAG